MGEPNAVKVPNAKPSEGRLDSWKEIAAYLDRDVTTAQRWERREGMPVHRHVHDKHGSVYALIPELDAWLQSRRRRLEKEENEPEAEALANKEGDQPRAGTARVRPWLGLAGVVVLGVLAVAYIISRGRADRASTPKIRSLAVLPLKNLSGDPGQEYLADGMTEALIGRLAQIRDLRVISHTSVMRFKDSQSSASEIARKLGVDALVEGSVTREGNRIRVTAQLIRGATDDHFWSETYDRELRDALSLESDVAQTIAEKVEVTVTGEERQRLAAARSIAPEVYESYLQGWYELNNGKNKSDFETSVTYFQNAVNRDPKFAPAYIGLAKAYNQLGSNFIGDPPDPAVEKEMSAAQKALELDPNLADAHILLADVHMWRYEWSNAEAEYKRALELNPNNSNANSGFAWWLVAHGRTEEALGWERHARELDPFEIDGRNVGWMLFEARRYDEALRELRSVLAVQPNDSVALWDLGTTLLDENQAAAAIPVLEKAVSASNHSPGVTGTLTRAYGQAGRRMDALRLLAELNRRRKKGFVPAGAFVNAYIGLGDNDQAFAWLEQGYREHSNILCFLKVDPAFDPLRGDSRFANLIHRVGLD
jgi:TolB-like protein/Tfp pilus assembly protein PilF